MFLNNNHNRNHEIKCDEKTESKLMFVLKNYGLSEESLENFPEKKVKNSWRM
jgi:hypothetical protein